MSHSQRANVDLNDPHRALLTDTLPFELPVSLTNDGFYRILRAPELEPALLVDLLECLTGDSIASRRCVPYKYGVQTASLGVRTLWLLHPASQRLLASFLESNANYICYLCENGHGTSLRHPSALGKYFFFTNPLEDMNIFRSSGPTHAAQGDALRHPSTFFSYAGFSPIHNFYDSALFLDLEETYAHLTMLDVARCFRSIYTHSIEWAIKGKAFTKDNLALHGIQKSFGDQFDKLMQWSNDGETNGIAIGPETSRIFAEIIFQRIDKDVIQRLEKVHNLLQGREFTLLRYVDDYFIFASSEETARKIEEEITDSLESFNLTLNPEKTARFTRPFITDKTQITARLKVLIRDEIDPFVKTDPSNVSRLQPGRTLTSWSGQSKLIIDEVRGMCHELGVGTDVAANFLLGSVTHKIQGIAYGLLCPDGDVPVAERERACVLLLLLLEVAFYCYAASPTASNSFKVARAIIIAVRASRSVYVAVMPEMLDLVLRRSRRLIERDLATAAATRRHFVQLGELNLLIALRELGPRWLIDPGVLRRRFLEPDAESDVSSFCLSTILYYVQGCPSHDALHEEVVDIIERKLVAGRIDCQSAEQVILFSDFISCPYITLDKQRALLRNLFVHLGRPTPSLTDLDLAIGGLRSTPWFTQWESIDMLRLLERRRLNHVY